MSQLLFTKFSFIQLK